MKRKKYIFSAYTKNLFSVILFLIILVGFCGIILPLAFNDYSIFWLLLIDPFLAIFIPPIFFERFAIADEEKITLYKYSKKKQVIYWNNVSKILIKKPKILNVRHSTRLKNLGFLLITDDNKNSIRLPHDTKTERTIRTYFKGEIKQHAVWFTDLQSIYPSGNK